MKMEKIIRKGQMLNAETQQKKKTLFPKRGKARLGQRAIARQELS
jgi:hypothetical protein